LASASALGRLTLRAANANAHAYAYANENAITYTHRVDREVSKQKIPADVLDVHGKLRAAGHEAYLVGGAVRDLLLGRETKDWDIATRARPEQVMKVFGRKFTVPTGLQHGTVTVVTDTGRNVEVTTYRGEGAYSDGRRPDEVFFLEDIDEDLARRDFTINALAYDPTEEALRDPWGGIEDLANRLIRAVGDPLARFGEDGLRTMRAVRFASQLGFAVDPGTLSAIPQRLDVFRKVSAERVRDELLKLLSADHALAGLRLMLETGLLGEVMPELLEAKGCAQNRWHAFDVLEHTFRTVAETPSRDPVVRLAALLHDVAKPRTAAPREDSPGEFTFFRHETVGAEVADTICRRLKLATAERERVCLLVAQHMFWYVPEWTDGTVVRFLRRVGPENVDDLFALRAGDVLARGHGEDPDKEIADLRRRVQLALEKQAALKITDLAIGGQDVMSTLGVSPGPIIGEVLRALLERVTDDPALNERTALLALLPQVAEEIKASRPT
jgi:tRNA nucleotidyltransferase (CCA-adding enzyme)